MPAADRRADELYLDGVQRCAEAGLDEPEFMLTDGFLMVVRRPAVDRVAPEVAPEVTPEVTPEVRLAMVLKGAMTRRALQESLSLRDSEHFRTAYLAPALEAGLIEMTIPDKPASRLQRYRLTEKGWMSCGR
jgi:ATP-dependent DNA helicase RecG